MGEVEPARALREAIITTSTATNTNGPQSNWRGEAVGAGWRGNEEEETSEESVTEGPIEVVGLRWSGDRLKRDHTFQARRKRGGGEELHNRCRKAASR